MTRQRRKEKRIDPANWASLKPFGIGEGRPNNYMELVQAARENKDQLRYAWRILNHGTCDGCALGTIGMKDWTLKQIHLCNVRPRLLRLNTMPAVDPSLLRDAAALASSQMLVDPAETVLVLPAQTRYAMVGGVTETSTERRIIFRPEIPGPRIAEAWPEWRIFGEIAARARPELADRVRYADTAAIRADIAAAIPSYAQFTELSAEGDQFQYGGKHLCADWNFPTPDGKAHFAVVRPPARQRDGTFVVATRRGKQFNSMIHENRDALNGAEREAVLMNSEDARRLGLVNGDAVVLRSDLGEMRGRVFVASITPGNLQVHWPEGQVLIDFRRRAPRAQIPDYNAVVTVVRATDAASAPDSAAV